MRDTASESRRARYQYIRPRSDSGPRVSQIDAPINLQIGQTPSGIYEASQLPDLFELPWYE